MLVWLNNMYTPLLQRKITSIGYIPVAERVEKPEVKPFEIELGLPKMEIQTTTPMIKPEGFIGGFVKDIGQSIARNIASAGVTVAGAIAPKKLKQFVEPLKAEDFQSYFGQALVETVFGKRPEEAEFAPTKSIEQRIVEAEPKVKKWQQELEETLKTQELNARERFILKVLSNLKSTDLAFTGIMGSVGFDLTPFGGLEKNVYKSLIKEATEAGAELSLRKMGVADDLVKVFAKDVIKISDEKTAKLFLDNLMNVQSKTKALPFTAIKGEKGVMHKELEPLAEEADLLTKAKQAIAEGKSAEEFVKAKYKTSDELADLGNDMPKGKKDALFVQKEKPINELSQSDFIEPYEWKTEYGSEMLKDIKSGKKLSPIVIDKNGTILDGNHRYEIYQKLGVKDVSVFEEVNQTKSQLTEKAKILPKTQPTKIPQVTYKQVDEIAEKLKRKDITEMEFEDLSVQVSNMKEAVENSDGKSLVKYMSRTTGELPEVTGKGMSKFGRYGDDIVTELGFGDVNAAQKGLDDYLNLKAQLKDISVQLSNLRTEKSAIRRGEYLMQLAKGDRRMAYRAVRDAFNLSETELAKIRQGKDIMAMTKEEFDEFLRVAEGRASQIAERSEALVQLKGTIAEKELRKWENMQQAMKLPKISEMNIEQIKQLDDILSQYKTGDEFLPVRQIETIDNTVLKGIRTTREVIEHLAKINNLTPETLPPIKPHPWMYDTQLARQHPLYDLLVDRYNYSYLKANSRILELEKTNDLLVKTARQSSPKKISEKIKEFIAPTDKRIIQWIEVDETTRTTLAKSMTPEELKAAKYQDSIYREYYEWLSKREMEKKFSSRFEDKYFPHTRRGFLEAWKEDNFLKAFKESTDQFKQEEKLLTILEEKTDNILPYQKWVGFTQFRTGKLVPTQNASRAFKTYITALEKARQFDEFIPEVMVYVHALSPKGLTPRGVELDDSLKRFVKQWINTKKGRIETQIIKPGSRMDWALRMGVTITRIRDLGLNIPIGIANIFGEQATNLTMLGAKNYSLGVARLATSKGREITAKYVNFVGKTFWEGLTEASNTVGDQLLGGIYGLFGAASRRGNQIFLLGSMTTDEFAKGTISLERLAQLRKGMGKYRVVEGAESIFGKSVEGAIGGQYKKWSIPILVSTKDNAISLVKILKTKGVKEVLKSKEGSELFYSVVLGSALGFGTYGYYQELKDKKDRNFVEDIIFKSSRDAMSLIGALDPKFIGSFAAPRLASFIVDITEAIDNIIFWEKYKTTGELIGVKQLKKILTPIAVTSVIEKEEKAEPTKKLKTPFGLPEIPSLKNKSLPTLPGLPKLPRL